MGLEYLTDIIYHTFPINQISFPGAFMLNIEKWAQYINPVIAYFAVTHALIARQKCEAGR